jgi:threonine/homoserine/homoserine lactone efflux protein
MKHIFLFLLAVVMGFVTAIPVGGSQIEAVKRAISGDLRAAWMVVLGSVSSDTIYGITALFGIASFLELPWVMAAFSAVGAVVLWIIAFLTFKESKKLKPLRLENWNTLKSKRGAFFSGFSLAITNPPMILTWLYGATLAKSFGLATPFTNVDKVLFITGGVLGLGGYLASLSTVVYRAKHFIPTNAIKKIYYWLGIALFLLSFFFVYRFLKYL